jgi:hypothetical protein
VILYGNSYCLRLSLILRAAVMKKAIVVTLCVAILCCALTASFLLQPEFLTIHSSPPSTEGIATHLAQPTPKTTIQPAPTIKAQPTPESTSGNNDLSSQLQTPPPPVWVPAQSLATGRNLEDAIGNATYYLDLSQQANAPTQAPYALLLMNVLYRQFCISDFANSLQLYDQILSTNPDNTLTLQLLRRIADYNNSAQVDSFSAVQDPLNQITIPALYSDRLPLPENYSDMLNEYLNDSGYMMTHALLATIWLQENNCTVPNLPDNFTQCLYSSTAALITNDTTVTDLEVEAAAMLYEAGQGTLVNGNFVQNLINAQNVDGGWSLTSNATESSNWHTTVLALMVLLYVENPAPSYPPMIAPQPS